MSNDIQNIARDPLWLAHRYVESKDAVQFLPLTREEHRAATFITDEHLPPGRERRELPRREAVATASPSAPVHFIFHSAFCCSTLLARVFDREGLAMGLKEPLILNDMVGWRRRGASGRDVAEVTDGALKLLARPFAPGEAVIVKPSNIVNGLIPLLMAVRPNARALFLYAPLPVFLTSVAKKGLDGRLWVRELLIGFHKDGLIERLGFDDEALFGQTDLQIAATGWLAQQALFQDLAQALGGRVRTLDSETLLGAPDRAVRTLVELFGLTIDPETMAELVRESFGRDSKTGKLFGRADREAEYQAAGAVHRDEIGKVNVWAKAVAETQGIALQLGNELIR
jgi:hypothetical protein